VHELCETTVSTLFSFSIATLQRQRHTPRPASLFLPHGLSRMLLRLFIAQEVRTVQENDLGRRLLDVNYFHALPGRRPRHRIFICP